MASSIKSSTSSGGDLETLPQQALQRDPVASSTGNSTSSGGDLETLPQQALQHNRLVTASIGNKDLETLTLQALQHDLMAASFTQSTTESTLAQQSSQEATVLQARQPEAVLAWPTRSWGCSRTARRCISILIRCFCLCLPKERVRSPEHSWKADKIKLERTEALRSRNIETGPVDAKGHGEEPDETPTLPSAQQ
ncbi:hypothetical protein AAY473_031232 [Plecturocebus cupreus]